ncbi:MAG TPA: sigma-70 family RNA polymerase sigma factor [Acidimicrobiia bacterium]|nr:sigma-70 family RNA polymerase sigma factor [Acidimicrobiia bacterium]
MDSTDAALLAAASGGDADSFGLFFRRHVAPVTLYGVRRCSDPEDVADLVAETFLVALQASGRYVPENDTALPWLFGIARRVLAKQRRRRAGTRRLLIKATNTQLLFTSSEEDAVAAAIDAARQAPALEAALAALSASEREVVELVAYDGLSPSEVAGMLNLSPNAARLRLSRARRHMRQMLDPAPALEPEPRHAF